MCDHLYIRDVFYVLFYDYLLTVWNTLHWVGYERITNAGINIIIIILIEYAAAIWGHKEFSCINTVQTEQQDVYLYWHQTQLSRETWVERHLGIDEKYV